MIFTELFSDKKIQRSKRIQSADLLYDKPASCHSTTKSQVTDTNFKLTQLREFTEFNESSSPFRETQLKHHMIDNKIYLSGNSRNN